MNKLTLVLLSLGLISACGSQSQTSSNLAHTLLRSQMTCQSNVSLANNPGAVVKGVRLVFNEAMTRVSFARYVALSGYLSSPEQLFQDWYLSSLENFDVVRSDASSTLTLLQLDREFGTLTPLDDSPSALRLTMDGVSEVLACSR